MPLTIAAQGGFEPTFTDAACVTNDCILCVDGKLMRQNDYFFTYPTCYN